MKLPAPLMFSHTANSCALTGLTQLFYTLQVNKINEYAQQILMSNNGIKKTVLIFFTGLAFSGASALRAEELAEENLIEFVRRKNLRLLADKLNVDLAKAERIQAALWANPSIGIASTLNPFRTEYDQTTSAGPRQIDLGIAIPLDLSGKRRAASKSADVAIELATAAYTDKIRTTIRDARLAFVQSLYLRDKLSLLRQKKNAMQSLVRILENRIGMSVRNVQPLLLDRTRLAVENAAAEERAAEAEYVAGLVELRVLCGYAGTDEINPVGRLRTQAPQYPDGLIALLSLARERRPDIKAATLAVALAREQLNLARAERWDDIEFTLGLTLQLGVLAPPESVDAEGNVTRGTSLPGEYSFGFGVKFPLPVIDRKQGNLKKAEYQINQAELSARALEREVENEVIKAWNKIKSMRTNLAEYERVSLKRAQRVKDAQQRLFGTGGVNLLEYFDAYAAYFATLSGYNDAAADFRRACIELEAAAAIGDEAKITQDEVQNADR